MNILTNEKVIRRNTRIAQIASFGGLIVLIGGMVVAFTRQELVTLSFAALLVGFILSQVGIYFTNRWGRRPRPDELLNQALKGLDGKYTLYHFYTPAAHLLVGPAGIWTLLTKHQRGIITYANGRWRQRGGGLLQGYLRLFAQEGLGRPDLEVANEIENIQKYLGKLLPSGNVPPIYAALVFSNPDVDLQIDEQDEPAVPTLPVNKLKNYIRKSAKEKPISLDRFEEIRDLISTRIDKSG